MKAVVVEGEQEVVVRDRSFDASGSATVVRVELAGLCGTDLKILDGWIAVRHPRIIGHEIVGRVTDPGEAELPVGARVLVDPSRACLRCQVCRNDNPHLCRGGALMGRDVDGGAAEYVAVPANRLHPLPGDVDRSECALLQVLATCLHGQELVRADPGMTAAVLGLGVAGMLHVQLLRARGVDNIVAVTRSSWKQELAEKLGATAVVSPDDAAAVVADLTYGQGVDLAVECAGTAHTLRQAMLLTGPGGEVLVFGTTAPSADAMPTYHWYLNELTLRNPRAARPRDYACAASAASDGSLHLGGLLTSVYPLDDAQAAFAACRDPAELKVALAVS